MALRAKEFLLRQGLSVRRADGSLFKFVLCDTNDLSIRPTRRFSGLFNAIGVGTMSGQPKTASLTSRHLPVKTLSFYCKGYKTHLQLLQRQPTTCQLRLSGQARRFSRVERSLDYRRIDTQILGTRQPRPMHRSPNRLMHMPVRAMASSPRCSNHKWSQKCRMYATYWINPQIRSNKRTLVLDYSTSLSIKNT